METEIKVSKGWSWIYNKTLKLEHASFKGHSAVSFCLKWLRQHKIMRTSDFLQLPLILTEIEGKKLVVPLSHNLAFYKENFSQYDKHIISICQYIRNILGELSFIDVGANVGDTVLNVGITDKAHYLCIEGDAFFHKLLRYNLEGCAYSYKAIHCFLTDEINLNAKYFVEHAVSSARLKYENNSDSENSGQVFKRLDDIVKEEKFVPNILKIDTDGFDFKVLRGCRSILQEFRPVLFFEWWSIRLKEVGENTTSIFVHLYELGYKRALFFDNYGNKLVSCFTDDTNNLRRLSEYSCNYQNQIRHYDVLIFHELSELSIEEFEFWCNKK